MGWAGDISQAKFYFSGPHSEDAATLERYGLNTAVIEDQVGQASGLKFCCSGMIKAISVVGMDLLLIAHK